MSGRGSVPFVRLDTADRALRDELIAVVSRLAETGAFTLGAEVAAFEAEFAEYCEAEHVVGVSSGTDAIALALRALGVGPGDEVVLPANSFIATAEAVSLVGATPRVVDVDPETHLLTAELVEPAIGPATRCVIPVHLYGATVDLDPIVALAGSHGIAVVEDACQAHGAVYRGRRVGTVGDLGCFSFYPTKNLGGWGDGGAVVTADSELATRVRLLRSHGEQSRHHHRIRGTTARLDAIQAAVLRVKLRRLDDANAARRRIGAALRSALEGTAVHPVPTPSFAGADHVHHLFVVRTPARDDLRASLDGRGIGTAVHYPVPIHLTDAYRDLGAANGSCPEAERLAGEICSLPLFPDLSEHEFELMTTAIADWSAGVA